MARVAVDSTNVRGVPFGCRAQLHAARRTPHDARPGAEGVASRPWALRSSLAARRPWPRTQTASRPRVGLSNAVGRKDRKSTRLNSSHSGESRMPSSA